LLACGIFGLWELRHEHYIYFKRQDCSCSGEGVLERKAVLKRRCDACPERTRGDGFGASSCSINSLLLAGCSTSRSVPTVNTLKFNRTSYFARIAFRAVSLLGKLMSQATFRGQNAMESGTWNPYWHTWKRDMNTESFLYRGEAHSAT
jgi:hypothetical protein